MLNKIGPFDVFELVGRGAMGSVFRGIDPTIGRSVAIKVVRLVGYNDEQEAAYLRDRLFKEARAAGRLSHPGIVTIYQAGVHDDLAYIAMEFVDGPTLAQLLASAGPVDPDLLARTLTGAAAALDYAHQRAVVHRDVKPSNIMFPLNGHPKVTDFGIAKTMLGHTATSAGIILGTPFYMSPEQVQGKPLDGRSDQFALAVIAYEILTRRRPFCADQVTGICYQIIHEEPTFPADLNSELMSGVSAVLRQGLAKNPADRFATCSQFAANLVAEYQRTTEIHSHGGVSVPEPSATGPPPLSEAIIAASPKKHRLAELAIWATVAVVVTLFLLFLFKFQSRQFPRNSVAAARVAAVQPPPKDTSPAMKIDKPAENTRAHLPLPKGSLPLVANPLEQRAAPMGRVYWRGRASAGTLLEIEKGSASVGKVTGAFPGLPIDFHVSPASVGPMGLTVYTSMEKYAVPLTEQSVIGPVILSWDPRHQTDFVLWETPGPANGWRRLVLRVNADELTGFLVEWRALNPQR